MKKTFLAILFALISFASAFAAVGDTFTVGGVTYKVTSTDPKEVAVSGYTDEIPVTLTLPAEVNGYAVTSIGEEAFNDCTALLSIEIPNCVTSIGTEAFNGCSKLASIKLPSSLTSIDASAFENCTSLTNIKIPASVTSIGDNVFANCTSLTSITCLGTTHPSASENTFINFDKSACTLNVPIGYTDTYGNAENWDGFKAYIEDITTGIEDVIGDSDPNTAVEVYNLNGVKVADSTDNLRSGLYIIR